MIGNHSAVSTKIIKFVNFQKIFRPKFEISQFGGKMGQVIGTHIIGNTQGWYVGIKIIKHRKNCETALVSVWIKENVFFCQVGSSGRYLRKVGQWLTTTKQQQNNKNKKTNQNNKNNNKKQQQQQHQNKKNRDWFLAALAALYLPIVISLWKI